MSSSEMLASFEVGSPEETFAVGQRLGRLLRPSSGIGLRGELGAGKTVFVRGVATGLGVDDPEEVQSPTYLLLVEHPGPVPLLHMDAYFAERGADFLADGGEAYLEEGGVLAIEWAEKLGLAVPDDFLIVELEHRTATSRRLTFRGNREPWGPIVAQVSPAGSGEIG